MIEYINELNKNIIKIKHGKEFELNLTILLPLLNFLKTFNLIDEDNLKMIIDNETLKIKELKYYKFTEFSRISEKIDDYLSEFTDDIINQLPPDIDVQSVDFLLYEILINVYKHSKFNNAYLQVITQNNQYTDICIFDNGIGIPGSFKEASMKYNNDCEAIFDAINGKTTDKEKYALHGRGLNSTARLTTLGFGGEMLIASGKGICVITKEGAKPYLNDHEIKGTFVILRINNSNIDDIYKYLKYENITRVD